MSKSESQMRSFELIGQHHVYKGTLSYTVEHDEGRMYYDDMSGQPPTTEITNIHVDALFVINEDGDATRELSTYLQEEFDCLLDDFITQL